MSSRAAYTSLDDLGAVALSHRDEVDAVKHQIGIPHGYFDAWIYGFLENKKFDVDETVAKLHRRFEMEVRELASYELTDNMRESLRKGIIQDIGQDKAGRVAFFINTKRDFPQSKYRDEQRRTFDMFVSYGTRLRMENKRCQIVMIINQDGASMFKNVDMGFQADVALRISKYYPGGIDKMYICKMSRTLAAMAKPIFKRLPAIVSDRIQIIDDNDIKNGVLLELFDEAVLPVALGGTNNCDDAEHWNSYADRVEKYYAELKRAVNEKGLTVKEFELEALGVNPTETPLSPQVDTLAQSVRSMALYPSNSGEGSYSAAGLPRHGARGSTSVALKTLMTCLSDEDYDISSPSGMAVTSAQGAAWAQIVEPFPRGLAVFFLEELLRWRSATEDEERAERFKLLDYQISAYQKITGEAIKGLNVGDGKWYVGIPYPLRSLYRLLLMGVTTLNVIYYIGAIIFCAVFSADVIVTVFFGCFVKPSFFFPLSAVLLMVAIQAAAICSRACDFVSAIYNGNVVPPFERLGSTLGTIAEVTLFFVTASIQFIIFCLYARRESPLKGLQVSFATGWLSAVFIVAFTHAFFFTGLFTSNTNRGTENRLAALPFFLALNFGGSAGKDKTSDVRFILRMSSFLICGIPLAVSMILGIGFLISRIVSLYPCTMAAALSAAFLINYYTDSLSNTMSSSLVRFTLWMMTVVWLYVTFAFGFQNFSSSYASSVIVAAVLNGAFVLLALLCLRRMDNSWLLRISFVVVLLYILACAITLFPLVDWRLGIFCFALLAHNVLNIVFSPRDLTNIHATFFVVAAVLLLGISCVLLGWYGTSLLTTEPQSLPSTTASAVVPSLHLYHQYPVCTVRLGADDSVTVVDVALLMELVVSRTTDVFETDFTRWFGSSGVVYDGIVQNIDADGTSWAFHQFTMPAAANLTVLALTNRYALSSIVAMVAWVDAIALSPLSIFLPVAWTDTIVYVMSFVTRLIPFGWTDLLKDMTDFIDSRAAESTTDLLFAGSGIAGGFLSVAASRAEQQAIVFAAPGLLQTARKLDISESAYHHYVLTVGAQYGVLNCIGGQDVTIAQKLICDGSALYCIRPTFFSTALLEGCGDSKGRQHR